MRIRIRPVARVVAVMVIAALAYGSVGWAYEADDGREGPADKLGRGFGNLLTGWMEIPYHVGKEVRRYRPVTGVFTGLAKGITRGWLRTAVGAFEIVTFLFPIPHSYDPLLSPPEYWKWPPF